MSLSAHSPAGAAPTVSTPSTPRVHLGYLDSLRALAALYVIVHHAADLSIPSMGGLRGLTLLLVGPFRYGNWAVDLFIVLSGFCLMLPAAKGDGTLRGGAVRFFARRARRILPPYYLALALSVLVWLVFGHALKTQWGSAPAVSAAGILPSVLMLQDVFLQQFNPAFWSVAVEWRIYFLFPLLVLLWKRIGPLPTTLLSVLAACGLFLALRHSIWVRITPEYLALFVFGMLAAHRVFSRPLPSGAEGQQAQPRRVPAPAAAVFLAAAFALNYKWRTTLGGEHLFAINMLAGAGMAFGMAALAQGETNALRRLLNGRGLVFIGTYAYSIYLVHMPLLVLLWHYAVQPLHLKPLTGDALLVCLGIPVILGAAYLFFLVGERPFLNTRRGETLAETARDAALSPAP